MVESQASIPVYEEDGTARAPAERFYILSHKERASLVLVRVGEEWLTVSGYELLDAVRRCMVSGPTDARIDGGDDANSKD